MTACMEVALRHPDCLPRLFSVVQDMVEAARGGAPRTEHCRATIERVLVAAAACEEQH